MGNSPPRQICSGAWLSGKDVFTVKPGLRVRGAAMATMVFLALLMG